MPFPIEALRNLSQNIIGMPETVEVIRTTRVPDGEGGFTVTPAAVATYPGRYTPAGARELQIASYLANSVEGTITLPYDAEILETDTLRLVRDDITYNVTGIMAPTVELRDSLKVLVRRA